MDLPQRLAQAAVAGFPREELFQSRAGLVVTRFLQQQADALLEGFVFVGAEVAVSLEDADLVRPLAERPVHLVEEEQGVLVIVNELHRALEPALGQVKPAAFRVGPPQTEHELGVRAAAPDLFLQEGDELGSGAVHFAQGERLEVGGEGVGAVPAEPAAGDGEELGEVSRVPQRGDEPGEDLGFRPVDLVGAQVVVLRLGQVAEVPVAFGEEKVHVDVPVIFLEDLFPEIDRLAETLVPVMRQRDHFMELLRVARRGQVLLLRHVGFFQF